MSLSVIGGQSSLILAGQILGRLTGASTLATGALLYGAGTSSLSTLPIGTANQVMTVNAGATAPQWSSSLVLTGTIAAKQAAAAGIQLDPNAATGNFTLSLSPANITAARRWSFPDRSDTVAGLGAQTFTGLQTLSGGLTVSAGTITLPALSVALAALNASGTPSGTTYLRGDGTWATVSAGTPAGSTGYIQFNNAGAFAAEASLFWDATNKVFCVGTGAGGATYGAIRAEKIYSGTSSFNGNYFASSFTPSGALSGVTQYGARFYCANGTATAANYDAGSTIVGQDSQTLFQANGAATLSTIYGHITTAYALNGAGSGTVSVSSLYGHFYTLQAYAQTSGGTTTISAMYGVFIRPNVSTVSGSTCTITSWYGLYIDTPNISGAGTGSVTNQYPIYQASTTGQNYFGAASNAFTGSIAAPSIGTSTAASFLIKSNNTTAITIDTSQNVGIGGSPSYKLDVAGTAACGISGTTGAYGFLVRGGNSGTGNGSYIGLLGNGTATAYLGNASSILAGAYDATTILWCNTSSAFKLYTNATLGLTMDTSQNVTLNGSTAIFKTNNGAAPTANTFAGHQIFGCNTGTAATAGTVGEYFQSTGSASASTGAYVAVVSITLTAGEWDISGWCYATFAGVTFTSGGSYSLAISTTSASSAGTTTGYDYLLVPNPSTSAPAGPLCIPRKIVSITASTTYYLNVLQTFTAGTCTIWGSINARRRR
jgi:hypothetical protein